MHNWLHVLAGFTKCNKDWPLSWFPAQEDHIDVFAAGQAYSLPFAEGQRHHQFAKLGSLNRVQQLEPALDSNTLAGTAW
jgi:hypothetical protein